MKVGRKAHALLLTNSKIYNYIQVAHHTSPFLQTCIYKHIPSVPLTHKTETAEDGERVAGILIFLGLSLPGVSARRFLELSLFNERIIE